MEAKAHELDALAENADAQMAEIARTRDALTAMHAQIGQEQSMLNAQREELLDRLGSPPRTPAIPSTSPPPVSRPPAPPPQHSAQPPDDKQSTADSAARQFRKLRRDAKRRAIGA